MNVLGAPASCKEIEHMRRQADKAAQCYKASLCTTSPAAEPVVSHINSIPAIATFSPTLSPDVKNPAPFKNSAFKERFAPRRNSIAAIAASPTTLFAVKLVLCYPLGCLHYMSCAGARRGRSG